MIPSYYIFFIFLGLRKISISPPIYHGLWDLEFFVFSLCFSQTLCLGLSALLSVQLSVCLSVLLSLSLIFHIATFNPFEIFPFKCLSSSLLPLSWIFSSLNVFSCFEFSTSRNTLSLSLFLKYFQVPTLCLFSYPIPFTRSLPFSLSLFSLSLSLSLPLSFSFSFEFFRLLTHFLFLFSSFTLSNFPKSLLLPFFAHSALLWRTGFFSADLNLQIPT